MRDIRDSRDSQWFKQIITLLPWIRKSSNTDIQKSILIQMSTECDKNFTHISDPYWVVINYVLTASITHSSLASIIIGFSVFTIFCILLRVYFTCFGRKRPPSVFLHTLFLQQPHSTFYYSSYIIIIFTIPHNTMLKHHIL
jgi:hypothetical protein